MILIRGGKFDGRDISHLLDHGIVALRDGNDWEVYSCQEWGGYVFANYIGRAGELQEGWTVIDGDA